MNEKNLISVIIPVYNMEKYLTVCIESLLNQSYKEFEVILVNDGSTDSSELICRRYEKEEDKIHVVKKENGGLSSARNFGMKFAQGRYITFIDSDDYVGRDYLKVLIDTLLYYDSDISICESIKFFDGQEINTDIDRHNVKNYDNIAAFKAFCYQRIPITAWGKLYKIELFKNIEFPEGFIYEDVGTTYKLFLNAKKISYNDSVQYYYYQRAGSIMGTAFSSKNMDRYYLSLVFKEYITENYSMVLNACYTRIFLDDLMLLRDCPFTHEYMEYIEIIKEDIKQYRKKVLFNSEAGLRIRSMAFLSFGSLRILKALGKIYEKIKNR